MNIRTRVVAILLLLVAVSCVTINIYFPAEEVRDAADKIVNEVWGERRQAPEPPPADGKGSFLPWQFGPANVYAAQDIDITTPQIRAIKAEMKQRASALRPYLEAGQVGIGRDGLLAIRSTEGLDLRGRAEVQRLVKEENADRQRLYQEIARANGFPEKVDEVRAIFADSWRENAHSGWLIQTDQGAWNRK